MVTLTRIQWDCLCSLESFPYLPYPNLRMDVIRPGVPKLQCKTFLILATQCILLHIMNKYTFKKQKIAIVLWNTSPTSLSLSFKENFECGKVHRVSAKPNVQSHYLWNVRAGIQDEVKTDERVVGASPVCLLTKFSILSTKLISYNWPYSSNLSPSPNNFLQHVMQINMWYIINPLYISPQRHTWSTIDWPFIWLNASNTSTISKIADSPILHRECQKRVKASILSA